MAKKLVNSKRWPGVYKYESQSKRHMGKPDVCYHVAYRLDGKLTWEKVGWKSEGYTPQIASELRAERLQKARHGEQVKTHKEIRQERQRANRTLAQVAKAYFKVRGNKTKAAKIDKGRYENHVAAVLGKRPIKSLTPLDMERLKKAMAGLSAASIWGALEMVRRIANFGAKSDLCDPLGFTIKMPRRDNEVVEFLTPHQLARFRNVLRQWPNKEPVRMLELAMYTGMRKGEIFKLEERDVDFENDLIVLRNPKGGRTVSIPMSDKVRRILRAQIRSKIMKYSSSPFLFPGKTGQMRTACSAVNRIKKKAQLPKSFRIFHGLRHNFGVTLANSGDFSLDMIGELLTHKDPAMTKRYAQFLPDTKKRSSDRAAEILSGEAKKRPVLEIAAEG